MASFKIYALLAIVVLAMFSQVYASVYVMDDDDMDIIRRLVRVRRSHHTPGVTGPVHTFVKTDKHANFKWGVRHHVGHQYAGGN